MANTLKVTTYENGTVTETEVPISEGMAAALDKLSAWEGWCRCGAPETGRIEPRGHSVDVFCRNCGGCLQVG